MSEKSKHFKKAFLEENKKATTMLVDENPAWLSTDLGPPLIKSHISLGWLEWIVITFTEEIPVYCV